MRLNKNHDSQHSLLVGRDLRLRSVRWASSLAVVLFAVAPGCGNDFVDSPESAGGNAGAGAEVGGQAGALGASGGSAGADLSLGGDRGTPQGAHCDAEPPESAGDSSSRADGCGCLSVDDAWSCSEETCPDPDGTIRELRAEAGFLEIPGREFVAEGIAGTSPTHRIFYSFQPADDTPEGKPLLVFFNGGPGSATMPYLFAQTAPQSLIERGVEPNPSSFARGFNLLYIDAPYAGFSYEPRGALPFTHLPERDAGIFLELVLGFLERHPALERNAVGFLGESYGGTRALLMSERLLYYPELVDPAVRSNTDPNSSSVYFDPGLYDVIQAHFDRTRPNLGGVELSPEQVAEQFGWQILIQPGLPTRTQTSPSSICTGENCGALLAGPCTNDSLHDCSEPESFWDEYDSRVLPKLENPRDLSAALGVSANTIDWLRWCRPAGDNDEARIYLLPQATLSNPGEPFHLRGRMLNSFVRTVRYQRTLMTNARLDLVIRTPLVLAGLHDALQGGSGVQILADEPKGAPRPGQIEFEFPRGETKRVRFPSYAAGHMVTEKAAAELYDDIVAFWDGE